MKQLTKHQKMCVGVLALAAAALLTDRFVLSDADVPARASAEVAKTADVAAPAPAAAGAAEEGPFLADRLEKLASDRSLSLAAMPDAFAVPASWSGAAEQGGGETPAQDTARKFAQENTLQAVMVNGAAGVAVINGVCVAVGRQYKGFTLQAIGEQSAEFESPQGQRLTLKLQVAELQNNAAEE